MTIFLNVIALNITQYVITEGCSGSNVKSQIVLSIFSWPRTFSSIGGRTGANDNEKLLVQQTHIHKGIDKIKLEVSLILERAYLRQLNRDPKKRRIT